MSNRPGLTTAPLISTIFCRRSRMEKIWILSPSFNSMSWFLLSTLFKSTSINMRSISKASRSSGGTMRSICALSRYALTRNPPDMRIKSCKLSPSFNSYIAGRLISPLIVTVLARVGRKIVSSSCKRTSLIFFPDRR